MNTKALRTGAGGKGESQPTVAPTLASGKTLPLERGSQMGGFSPKEDTSGPIDAAAAPASALVTAAQVVLNGRRVADQLELQLTSLTAKISEATLKLADLRSSLDDVEAAVNAHRIKGHANG